MEARGGSLGARVADGGGWKRIPVASLGGAGFLVVGRAVFFVPSGSPEADRQTVERAIRTHCTFRLPTR